MLICYGLHNLPRHAGPTAVTVGMFDGVHHGHRHLLARVREEAGALGLPAAVVTFDRHPREVLQPGRQPPLLTTLRQKAGLLAAAGVDLLVILRFTRETSLWPAEEFATKVLLEGLQARVIVEGANFRFGHGGAGDVRLLEELGGPRGVRVVAVELLAPDGEVVSSTRVRAAVARGDTAAATRLLGRPHAVEGQVVRGAGRGGALLGVPTANLRVPDRILLPARGVYAGHVTVRGGGRPPAGPLPAVASVGVNPTFGGGALSVEAHLLDFDGDLYGRRLTLTFEHRLREERRYERVGDLITQMRADIRQARELLGLGR